MALILLLSGGQNVAAQAPDLFRIEPTMARSLRLAAPSPADDGTERATPLDADAKEPGKAAPPKTREPALVTPDLGVRFGVGPRFGFSLNQDQWIFGVHFRFDGVCILLCDDDWGVGVHLNVGVGGNHVTLRGSLRLSYTAWFVNPQEYGMYFVVGGAFIGWVPVGGLGKWCRSVDLDGCGGIDGGLELGVGFRFFGFGIEAIFGIGGIPMMTAVMSWHFELWRDASQ